ncbi:MAG: hypothetical protein AAB320_01155 [Elusimicrobiota bacterium]
MAFAVEGQNFLDLGEKLGRNDPLMLALGHFAAVADHPDINGVSQKIMHRAFGISLPAFDNAFRRRPRLRDGALRVHGPRGRAERLRLAVSLEKFDGLFRLGLVDDPSLVHDVVAQDGRAADAHSLFRHEVELLFHPRRCVHSLKLGHVHLNAEHEILVMLGHTVIVFRHRKHLDSLLAQEFPHDGEIEGAARKSVDIVDDHGVDAARANVRQDFLIGGSVRVAATIAEVVIPRRQDRNVFLFSGPLLTRLPLRFAGSHLRVVRSFRAFARVDNGAQDFRFRSCRHIACHFTISSTREMIFFRRESKAPGSVI